MALPALQPVEPGPRDAAIALLKQRFGDRCSTSQSVRDQHGKDESWHAPAPPDAVVFARSTEEVSDAVRICAEHKVPVIPFGTGTSLEGHVAALRGGVCIDVSQMNRVVRVSAEDLDCTVEAGVTRKRSTSICATPACSSRSIPAPTPRSAAWRRRAPPAPTPCATARCARTCCRSPSCCRRARDQDRAPVAQVLGGLRPHAALRRLRGHARRHHRGDAQALRHSRR
jgi:hypothetical protein